MLHLRGKEYISFHTRKHAVCMLIILLRVRYNFAAGYMLVRCDIQNLMCCLLDFILKVPTRHTAKNLQNKPIRLHQIMLPALTCAVLKHHGTVLPLQTTTMNSVWVSSLLCERQGTKGRTSIQDTGQSMWQASCFIGCSWSRCALEHFSDYFHPRVSSGFLRYGKTTLGGCVWRRNLPTRPMEQ